jgi:hypothetical protein
MAREKVTVTLDRVKVRSAMVLSSSRSMSDAIDVALDRFIREAELQRDIAAYVRHPLDDDEAMLGTLPARLDLGDEGVDYEVLYREPE